ncbi:3-isopropylmalate dehydratase large subunit, chloroplastic-like [Apium graveolens]|uniref:3-isopropylmalate dehydratase large subunit, chloroplastic-like n=1 Tax=Apium graveolens TaxID=4045 RepID=UPI003D797050
MHFSNNQKFDVAGASLNAAYLDLNFILNAGLTILANVALVQEGHCRPGEVPLGTDSHTCIAGAFVQFATCIGNTDAGFVLGTGKLLLKGKIPSVDNLCVL